MLLTVWVEGGRVLSRVGTVASGPESVRCPKFESNGSVP